MHIDWGAIGNGLDWILGLGILTTLVSAIITSIKDRNSRDRERRSKLANQLLDAVVNALHSRLQPAQGGESVHDTQLVYSHLMIQTEFENSGLHRLRAFVDSRINQVRYGQPVPNLYNVVKEMTPILVTWIHSPRKAESQAPS